MRLTASPATEPVEMEEGALGHGLVLGAMIGIPLVLAAIAIAVLLTGAGLSAALQIAGWPAIVAGPYAGGFIVLMRATTVHAAGAGVHAFPAPEAPEEPRQVAA